MWHIAHIYALTIKARLRFQNGTFMHFARDYSNVTAATIHHFLSHIAASQWISRPAMKLGFCFDRLCPLFQKQKFNLQNLRCIFLCLAFKGNRSAFFSLPVKIIALFFQCFSLWRREGWKPIHNSIKVCRLETFSMETQNHKKVGILGEGDLSFRRTL